jgi:hypothetical protein
VHGRGTLRIFAAAVPSSKAIPMIDPRTSCAALPAESQVVGIVVQGVPSSPVRPHLAFMWGPEAAPVPSIVFGRERNRAA